MALSGGAAVTLDDAENPWGASWGADDMILYGQGPDGIWRVPGTSGTPEVVITMEEEGEFAHGPQMLPGDEWVLFTVRPAGITSWDQAQIVMQSLATGERVTLIEGGRDARYVETGHLVFLDDLRAEFRRLQARRDGRSVANLRKFRDKLGALRLFDPACGCGNFLIIAYRELRTLEIDGPARRRYRLLHSSCVKRSPPP